MEIEQLTADILTARGEFVSLIEGLDAARVEAPVGEGRWSPLQYLEHLVRAEEATLWRMFKAVDDARASRDVLTSPTPGASIEEVVSRTWREKEDAPPLAVPTLGGPVRYWIVRMARNEGLVNAFADLVESRELDRLAYPHPISGPFTMRQGLQFLRFHMDRHRGHVLGAVE